MKITDFAKLGSNEIRRMKDVITVLANYGFGEIFRNISIPGRFILPRAQKKLESHTKEERMRLALEELGTTYIKLGQFASTRPDILPEKYIKEFIKLQDDVKETPFSQVENVLKKEWGDNWREKFQDFNQKPIASASVAQVYEAQPLIGGKVAVKVLRPGVREKVASDIKLIKLLAKYLEEKFPQAKRLQLMRLSREFTSTLNMELDFKREALILSKIRENHLDMEDVFIPRVKKELSTESVLVMDFVRGLSISKAAMTRGDKKRISLIAIKSFFRQALRDGLFHADPHPGNILFTDDKKISYLDFGMVGRLSFSMRKQLIDLLMAIHSSKPEWIMHEVLSMGDFEGEIDRESLIKEIMEITERHVKVPIKEMSVGKASMKIAMMLNNYKISINPAYALVMRALGLAEESSKMLDPDINPLEVLKPELKKVYLERFKPGNMFTSWKLMGKSFSRFISELPLQMGQILKKLKEGQLEIEFKHVGLEDLINTLDQLSNRLTFGIIIAALIIGSSLVIQVQRGPMIYDIPLFGFIGFVLASIMGVWLLWSIIRSGKL
ncbi:MAG: ABC1 kinase family protein [Elusimicrobiota bacterium]